MKKPKLTPEQCRWMDEVHQSVRSCNRHPSTMDQAFCDVHDGNLYESEVAPFVRKGLLVWVTVERCDRRDGSLLGCKKTAFLTKHAIAHFWPDRVATSNPVEDHDMPARPESEFPTIRQLRDRMSDLIDEGFGELPVQIVVVPDSTLQAISRSVDPASPKPALMIEFPGSDGKMPVGLISADRLAGSGMPTRTVS